MVEMENPPESMDDLGRSAGKPHPLHWASRHKAHEDHPNGRQACPAQGYTKDAAPKQGCPGILI